VKRINRERVAGASCDGAEGDVVAEGLELLDVVVAAALGVGAPGEVVAPEVFVVAVVGEEVPADDEEGVADGDGGSRPADAAGEPPELGGEVAVAFAGGGPGALVRISPSQRSPGRILPERRCAGS